MTRTTDPVAQRVRAEFDNAWRDDVPVFGCCRKAVTTAVDNVDLIEVAALDVTERVRVLRAAVEAAQPGTLESHRCCSGHLANLAFDLPELVVPADQH